MSEEELSATHLMDLQANIHPELSIPRAPPGSRLSVCYFRGGTISGSRLQGVLLPGGGDWAEYLSEDSLRIDVRGVIQLDDRSLVYMRYVGIWHAQVGALPATLSGARAFLSNEHYLRVTASFEAASPAHRWLNTIVAVGIGKWEDAAVKYRFYEIL